MHKSDQTTSTIVKPPLLKEEEKKELNAIGRKLEKWGLYDAVSLISKVLMAPTTIAPGEVKPQKNTLPSDDAPPAMPYDNIGLGESVELLAKIYNSGNTVLIRAIAANLHAFSEAIDNKILALNTVNMMKEMDKRMTVMEKKLAESTAAPPQKAANG